MPGRHRKMLLLYAGFIREGERIMNNYPQLFTPGRIGHLWAPNRIVMAPMASNLASSSGEVSERLLAYYKRRAAGGAGAIVVEAASVESPRGRESNSQINIDHPRYITGLKRLTQTIQSCGSLAFIQLSHAGRQAYRSITGGQQPIAPSAVPCPMVKEVPLAMDPEDIKAIAARFTAAADYASEAGFDGIELHACHGYLINQFLSPHVNCRTDEYGGSLENRQRFLMDILKGIRERQPGLLVSVRLNIDDFIEGGLTMEDSLGICRALERHGAHVINASSGTYASGLTSIESGSFSEGWRLYLAAAVKQNVALPVIGGGMVASPAMAEKALSTGQADFIFIGRSLLADPFWPWHAQRGSEELIRPCIRCNNCIDSMFIGLSINCTVNPEAGREIEAEPPAVIPARAPAPGPDRGELSSDLGPGFGENPGRCLRIIPRAWIAGAGPAGLHAALGLARSGVRVRIYDPAARAGGLMSTAALPPFKHRIEQWRRYLIRSLQGYEVEWRLGESFEPALLDRESPDLLVLAVGAVPARPDIPGLESEGCMNALDALNCPEMLDGRRIAILGGGVTGCELADLACGRAAAIAIIERDRILARLMERKNRRSLLQRLDQAGVKRFTDMEVLAVTAAGVQAQTSDGNPVCIPADLVVLAAGFRSEAAGLCTAAREQVPAVYTIGDAMHPRGFKEAVLEGRAVAERFVRSWNELAGWPGLQPAGSAGALEIPGDGKGIIAD